MAARMALTRQWTRGWRGVGWRRQGGWVAGGGCLATKGTRLERLASTSTSNGPTAGSEGRQGSPPHFARLPRLARLVQPRISSVFTLLTVGAMVVTGIGLWQYTQEFKTWPAFLRSDLRQALLHEQRGEEDKALGYWHRAWTTARERRGELGSDEDAALKLSGIAVALGALLQKLARNGEAYSVYRQGLEEVLHRSGQPVITDVVLERAIEMAQRCGDLAMQLGRFDEAERWMTWSVGEILRTQGPTTQAAGASLEALGNLYQTLGHGKERLALPCFLQALAVLVPDLADHLPKGDALTGVVGGSLPKPPPLEPIKTADDNVSGDLDHAATVCCNISQILTLTPSPANLACAEDWTRYGIAMAERVQASASASASAPSHPSESSSTPPALPVLYFNLGMIKEMQSGTRDECRLAYRTSRDLAKRLGFVQGIGEADRALARLS